MSTTSMATVVPPSFTTKEDSTFKSIYHYCYITYREQEMCLPHQWLQWSHPPSPPRKTAHLNLYITIVTHLQRAGNVSTTSMATVVPPSFSTKEESTFKSIYHYCYITYREQEMCLPHQWLQWSHPPSPPRKKAHLNLYITIVTSLTESRKCVYHINGYSGPTLLLHQGRQHI